MSALDDLPADQRAVLELVLARGRDYDQIAALLRIDRAAVRERALGALDALGPQTGVNAMRRALITDYLLGQLPAAVGQDVQRRLTHEEGERAWARVVASELAGIASGPLPEIPPAGDEAHVPGDVEAAAELEGPPRSSRRGGAIVLALGAVIVVVVVVVIILVTSGGGDKNSAGTASGNTGATSTTGTGTSTGTGSTSSASVVPAGATNFVAEP